MRFDFIPDASLCTRKTDEWVMQADLWKSQKLEQDSLWCMWTFWTFISQNTNKGSRFDLLTAMVSAGTKTTSKKAAGKAAKWETKKVNIEANQQSSASVIASGVDFEIPQFVFKRIVDNIGKSHRKILYIWKESIQFVLGTHVSPPGLLHRQGDGWDY